MYTEPSGEKRKKFDLGTVGFKDETKRILRHGIDSTLQSQLLLRPYVFSLDCTTEETKALIKKLISEAGIISVGKGVYAANPDEYAKLEKAIDGNFEYKKKASWTVLTSFVTNWLNKGKANSAQ